MGEDRVRFRNWSNTPLLAYPRAYGYRRMWGIYTYRVRRTAAHRTAHITYRLDIIYYYLPHRWIEGTYGDPHTIRCGTGDVCCKYVHRDDHHRLTYPLLAYHRLY